MLRFQPLITTGAAALLVFPAVTGGGDEVVSLTSALEGTEHALQVLRGFQGKSENTDAVIALTEAPIASGPERDEKLEVLRHQVNLLQAELDVLEAQQLGLAGSAEPQPAFALPETNHASGTSITTGLTPEQLEALRATPVPSGPVPAVVTDPAPTTEVATSSEPLAEGAGYSADPIRHAQTCYRAGRFKEGFQLVASLETPDAVYLQARFLEKLGRMDEAISTLQGVIKQLPEGYESRRAKSDLSFYEWKRDFQKKLPETTEEEGDTP